MVRFDWQRPPLLIGLVLGGIAENNLFIATKIYGASWLLRPGVIVIILLIAGALLWPVFQKFRERRRKGKADTPMATSTPLPEGEEHKNIGSRVPNVMFALFFVLIFVYVLREAFFGFGAGEERAALFPIIIGIPGMGLSLLAFGKEFSSTGQLVTTSEGPSDIAPDVARRRMISIICWIFGFFISIWLLGFVISSALVTFLYLKFGAGEKWQISIILTLVAWGFFYGVFDYALHLPFPAGELQIWLGLD